MAWEATSWEATFLDAQMWAWDATFSEATDWDQDPSNISTAWEATFWEATI